MIKMDEHNWDRVISYNSYKNWDHTIFRLRVFDRPVSIVFCVDNQYIRESYTLDRMLSAKARIVSFKIAYLQPVPNTFSYDRIIYQDRILV